MSNLKMTENDIRRAVLRALIKVRFNDTPNQFATATGKPPGQINDMLSSPPRKSFGARIARQLEEKIGLPKYFFDEVGNANAESLSESFVYPARTPEARSDRAGYSALSQDERDLINGYRNAPDEVRRHLVNSVREYIKTDSLAA